MVSGPSGELKDGHRSLRRAADSMVPVLVLLWIERSMQVLHIMTPVPEYVYGLKVSNFDLQTFMFRAYLDLKRM